MHKEVGEENRLPGSCKVSRKTVEDPAKGGNSLFDREWEVFVIRRDRSTGNLIGATACCALAPVDLA